MSLTAADLVRRAQLVLARRRGQCAARTRAGTPCKRCGDAPGTRCRLHGGASTGPTSPEGRARIAEAQRARRARWRAERAATEVR